MSQTAYTSAEGNVVGSSPNLNLTIWFSRWRRTNEWCRSKTSSMNDVLKMYRMSFLTTKHVSGIFDQKKVARLKNWRFRRKKVGLRWTGWREDDPGTLKIGRNGNWSNSVFDEMTNSTVTGQVYRLIAFIVLFFASCTFEWIEWNLFSPIEVTSGRDWNPGPTENTPGLMAPKYFHLIFHN